MSIPPALLDSSFAGMCAKLHPSEGDCFAADDREWRYENGAWVETPKLELKRRRYESLLQQLAQARQEMLQAEFDAAQEARS